MCNVSQNKNKNSHHFFDTHQDMISKWMKEIYVNNLTCYFSFFTFSDRVRIEILHTPNHFEEVILENIFQCANFFKNKQKLSFRPATTPGVEKILLLSSTSSMFVYVCYYILLSFSPLNYHIYLVFLALLMNKPNSFICDFTKSKVVYIGI